jgi:site-specific recombinase
MGDERGFSLYERLPLDNKEKAMKFLIYGLLTAIIFGTILLISKSIADYATTWQALDNQQNEMNYMQGLYGYNDYIERLEKTTLYTYWMQYQVVIVGNIARIGVNVGLIFIMIAFVSFALNDKLDERMRRISLTLAGVVLFVVMFTTFFSNIAIMVT